MPLPAGQETEEIAAREARVKRFGKKAESGPDYTRIAEQQRDQSKGGTKITNPLDMTYDITVERIHRLAILHRRDMGLETFGIKEAEAFIRLFGEQLEARLNTTLKDFIKEKMSK